MKEEISDAVFFGECCGKTRDTKFCPDCGKQLKLDDPLICLLNHCRQQEKTKSTAAENEAIKSGKDSKEYRTHETAAERWKSWGDALADLLRERPAPILNSSVGILGLSVRSRSCLKSQDIRTVGQLIEYCADDLKDIRNFGETSLTEIRESLRRHGLYLCGEGAGTTRNPEAVLVN